MRGPDWDALVAALEAWRVWRAGEAAAGQPVSAGGAPPPSLPSVSTVAERYRRDPWAVLVSTILSLRTKDEVTLISSKQLLEKAPTPRELLETSVSTAERLIYPAGFYRTKIANLRKISSILIRDYAGQVPDTLEALLALPGVGRKTANLVLIEAFDKDGVCVDTHVHRICNRASWLPEPTKTPNDTEMALREHLPRRHWKGLNALLVLYGQRVCRPVSPLCSKCVITAYCARRGVEKFR